MAGIVTFNVLPVKLFIDLFRRKHAHFRFLTHATDYRPKSKCRPNGQSGHGVSQEQHGAASVFKVTVVSQNMMHANNMTFHPRWFSASARSLNPLKPEELKKRVDLLTDCFAEARELLGDARESLGSTYFSDDMMEAQEAVAATVGQYKALLAELGEDQRNDVIRTVGLRMEELKAQEQAIRDLLD